MGVVGCCEACTIRPKEDAFTPALPWTGETDSIVGDCDGSEWPPFDPAFADLGLDVEGVSGTYSFIGLSSPAAARNEDEACWPDVGGTGNSSPVTIDQTPVPENLSWSPIAPARAKVTVRDAATSPSPRMEASTPDTFLSQPRRRTVPDSGGSLSNSATSARRRARTLAQWYDEPPREDLHAILISAAATPTRSGGGRACRRRERAQSDGMFLPSSYDERKGDVKRRSLSEWYDGRVVPYDDEGPLEAPDPRPQLETELPETEAEPHRDALMTDESCDEAHDLPPKKSPTARRFKLSSTPDDAPEHARTQDCEMPVCSSCGSAPMKAADPSFYRAVDIGRSVHQD